MSRTGFFIFMMLSLFFVFTTNLFAENIQNSRLIPTDKVTVYQDGEKTAVYSREMPVPEGALLSCEGRCMVKLDEIALVAEDQSQFGIDSQDNSRYLYVKEGTVYFGISSITQPIIFLTSAGMVSADQVILKASSDASMLEGYVRAGKDGNEVGVIDGGSLILATNDGPQRLQPGQRFLIAQADMGDGATPGAGNGDDDAGSPPWWKFGTNLTGGEIAAIAGGVAIGGVVMYNVLDDDDKDKDASPSKP